MMRSIVGSSLNLRFLVVILAVVAMLAGAAQLRQMPVDILPEFSIPYVEIRTEALGLSAGEVESLITTPMEQDLLAGVPWLDTVHSKSVEGLSSIVVQRQKQLNQVHTLQSLRESRLTPLARRRNLPALSAHPGGHS